MATIKIPRNWIDVSSRNCHIPTAGEIITKHIKALGGKNVQLAKRGSSITYTLNGKRCRRWCLIYNSGTALVVQLEGRMRKPAPKG